jgi:hypothetical protein
MKEAETIEYFLQPDEKIIWQGKPKLTPFVISAIPATLFGLFFSSIPAIIFYGLVFKIPSGGPMGSIRLFMILFSIPFLIIGILILLSPLYNFLSYRFIEYAVTNKKIIAKGGLIGRDIKTLYYHQISDVEVRVGILGRIFAVGDIIFLTTGGGSIFGNFACLSNPYEVFKTIKGLIQEARTYPSQSG